jgi:hypothetical protein
MRSERKSRGRAESFSMRRHNGSGGEIRPEIELLLCCARLHVKPEGSLRLRGLLRQELDWDYLLGAASIHGVIPLLYHHLKANGPEAIPAPVWSRLQEESFQNTAWNLFLTRELLKILALFEAEGISAIPFKGPALAAFAYGNLSLRQFSDLDLLVRWEDLLRAKDLLISLGYHPNISLDGAKETAFLRSRKDYVFAHESNGATLDLHWKILPDYLSFPWELGGLWEGQLERRWLAGKRVLDLSPEDLLLALCMHGDMHVWERLAWLADVAALIEMHPEMDWGKILESADRLHSRRRLFVGLSLAKDLLDACLPEDIWERIKTDSKVQALARQVRQRLFREADSRFMIFGEVKFHLRGTERFSDKLKFFHVAFYPEQPELALLPLPRMLYCLYYLVRPFRLIGKHIFAKVRRSSNSDCGSTL